ncbi:hypothetical protein FDECE_8521 [Fusarium decemcellulare]|nr:hypothetical protein FDECE_8521 [Fusarium decemcellulare]
MMPCASDKDSTRTLMKSASMEQLWLMETTTRRVKLGLSRGPPRRVKYMSVWWDITNKSQVVSYSARAVEKLSDVIQTMNVSYPHSIKKGSVTMSGSNTAIDEATFKSADINLIVTVKVTNQTTLIKSNARFVPMKGIDPGSQMFHDSYGDSYISGFIEGGEFTGIISIKVIDRSNVDLTVNKIKARLDAKDSSTAPTEFTLNSNDAFSSNGSASVMGKTESHIHVSWMGGGQIKDGSSNYLPRFARVLLLTIFSENTPWDIDSIFEAAAAFPQRVSERPQRTWAILTKYKSNRSFMDWSSNNPVKTLEYDQVSSFTAELFDSYMDYKILLKYVQLIIDDPESYEAVEGNDAFDTSIETLLGIRLAMRYEQGNIIEAISVLSRDPGILARQEGWARGRITDVLGRFLCKATGSPIQSKKTPPSEEFDFSALIPAEVWKKWMPVPKTVSAPSTDKAALLQAKVDALTGDLQRKTEEHSGHSKSLQDEIAKLKSDNSSELETLRKNHDEELEAMRKKQGDYEILKAGEQSEIDKMFQRLEKEKNDAAIAAKNEKQTAIDKFGKEKDDAYNALATEKDAEIQRIKDEKQAAIDKLRQEKDDAYKVLAGENATLTANKNALSGQNGSLTTQLAQKTSAYNSLKDQYDSLKKENDNLVPKYTSLTTAHNTLTAAHDTLTTERNTLRTERDDFKGKASTFKDKMGWAGISEHGRMDNCLPYSYDGWIVMILMPYSRLALNANKDHHNMAHGWNFDMDSEDQIFRLDKANDHPDTPWTITHLDTGKLLAFINGDTTYQVRVREKNHEQIRDNRGGYWYIGHGKAGSFTWVLKNAQWPDLCIQFVHGGAENWRQAQSFPCTNAGDANWVIVPIEYFGSVFTNLGPLTTTYTPPASCTTVTTDRIRFANATSIQWAFGAASCGPAPMGDCLPSGSAYDELASYYRTQDQDHWDYYSPGVVCPKGWTTAGTLAHGDKTSSAQKSGVFTQDPFERVPAWEHFYLSPEEVWLNVLEASETLAFCCPSGWVADIWGGCYSSIEPFESATYTMKCARALPLSAIVTVYTIDGTSVSEPKYSMLPITENIAETKVFTTNTMVGPTNFDDVAIVRGFPPVIMVYKDSDVKAKDADDNGTSTLSTVGGIGSVIAVLIGVLTGIGLLVPW